MIKAAGILFIDSSGEILLLKRSRDSDHPREWCLPGGGIQEGETPEQAALREFQEECGNKYTGELSQISNTDDGNVDYTTFVAHVEKFIPKLNDEHTAFMWCDADDIPNKTHPGVKALLDGEENQKIDKEYSKSDSEIRVDASEVITEMDIAKKIRDKELTSPQAYNNMLLFALRITGTGVSFRPKLEEFVQRPPEEYLTDEFLGRCNGLPVIWIHPPNEKLDSDSFGERVVGTICLPYIEGDEVWGIAKIFDSDAAQQMSAEQLSTSPGVVFQPGTNSKIELKDGSHILIEGKPSLLDHLAIVENGVWDKGGKPSGVLLQPANVEMTEASRADSADQPDSSRKEKNMAEQFVEKSGNTAEAEILALLKNMSPKIDKIEALEARILALEEKEPVKADGEENKEITEVSQKDDSPEMLPPEAATNANAAIAPAKEDPSIVADKLRMDALEQEVAKLNGRVARQDDDEGREKLLEAQGRADAVEQCYGDSAPRPQVGQTVREYENAMVMKHLSRSPRWSKSNIKQITDPATFAVIRDEVYADAIKTAKDCIGVPEGTLIERVYDGVGGRKVHEFYGSPSAWTNEFKSPEMTGRINPIN